MPQFNTPKSVDENTTLFSELAARSSAMTGLLKTSQESLENSVRAMTDETLNFINQRLQRNSDTIALYRGCKDVNEFLAAQQKWFSDLAHDYYEESVRLGEVTRKLFADGMSAAEAPQPAAVPKEEKRKRPEAA